MSTETSYHDLNAMLNVAQPDGKTHLEFDKQAARQYFLEHVNPNTVFFHDLREKLDYLISEGYYEEKVLSQYKFADLQLIWAYAYGFKFRFSTFVGAFKFFTAYAMKTLDGKRYLERFEDRVAMVAITLAQGNVQFAYDLVAEIITRRFQPATPTFNNAGKARRGEFISCFLLRVEDSMTSIGRLVNSALQLSKLGGGVAINLSNLREAGASIKGIEGQASGVVPIMKMLDDAFSYANQLGSRDGAGAVYLNVHHPDIITFLDSKRENADDKIRIKTLSLGVVIPDITMQLAVENKAMYLFSPQDIKKVYGKCMSDFSITDHYIEMVNNPKIRKKKIMARELLQRIAEIQFESGYPYVMYEDTVNKANPIDGYVSMSNLCTEILQVSSTSELNEDLSYRFVGQDISCNLGSMNIAEVMANGDIGATVEAAIWALTSVSELSDIQQVPSVAMGNATGHSIGLGQMNMHGFLAKNKIHYGSPESINFTSVYFMTVLYHALKTSCAIAKVRGKAFEGFENSAYAEGGDFFDKYVDLQISAKLVHRPEGMEDYDITYTHKGEQIDWYPQSKVVSDLFDGIMIPTPHQWMKLRDEVQEHGLYNRNLQAVPPTGSISYINHSTASIHPIISPIEIRKEGKLGRVYYPAPYLTADTLPFYKSAYELGNKKIIDVYAAATQHIDQGLSLTLFFDDMRPQADGTMRVTTTRDLNRVQLYAWRRGIKTLYYIRLKQLTLEEQVSDEGCIACAL